MSSRPLAGGIAEVRLFEFEDGRKLVGKRTTYDARLEQEGLAALESSGGEVPAVVHVGERLLVLEHVEGEPDWVALGQTVAAVHLDHRRFSKPDPFGWHEDNVIGPLAQVNTPSDDWPTFYVEHRLEPYVGYLPGEVRPRLHRAIEDGRAQRLLDHDAEPSLVHGDLWGGNIVDGRWLIDPAVHRADREFDLAFAKVFGGISPEFFASYLRRAPLDPGWQERRPALQLYHLLVHVRLFGAGWVGHVVERLDQLGWR